MALAAAVVALAAAAVAAPWIYAALLEPLARCWVTRHIPGPPGHLLWGCIPELLRGPSFRVFRGWALQYGPVYRVRFLLGRALVVVTSPELYQPLLKGSNRLGKYTAPYAMFEVFTDPPQPNILSAPENETWRAVRRSAVAALSMANIKLWFPHITAVTQRLMVAFEEAGPGSVQDLELAAGQVTADVIGQALFGRDLCATCRGGSSDALAVSADGRLVTAEPDEQQQQGGGPGGEAGGRGNELIRVIRRLTVAMQQRNNPLNRWFPWRQAARDLQYWGGRMTALVREFLELLEEQPPPPHTLGAHLLACEYPSGEPLARNQLMAELGLFAGAGFETTAHTICWTLFLITTHPEVEARLLAELDSLGLLASAARPTPDPIKWEHLAQMKYLAAVLQESMRLYPVVSSGTARITSAPMRLGGYDLPAGQPVLIPFFAIHRSPALWPEPDAFQPERWLAGKQEQAPLGAADDGAEQSDDALLDGDYVDVAAVRDQLRPRAAAAKGAAGNGSSGGAAPKSPGRSAPSTSNAGLEFKDPGARSGWLPFSEGPRNCPGMGLAIVEVKAVLALLLGAFHFTLAPEMGGFEGVDAKAVQTITLQPSHSLLFNVTHRRLLA